MSSDCTGVPFTRWVCMAWVDVLITPVIWCCTSMKVENLGETFKRRGWDILTMIELDSVFRWTDACFKLNLEHRLSVINLIVFNLRWDDIWWHHLRYFLRRDRSCQEQQKTLKLIKLKLVDFKCKSVHVGHSEISTCFIISFSPFPVMFNSVCLFFLFRKGSHGVHYFDHNMRTVFAVPRTGTLWVSVIVL